MFNIFSKKKTPVAEKRDTLLEYLTPDVNSNRSEDAAWEEMSRKHFDVPHAPIVSFDNAGSKKVFDSSIAPLYPANNFLSSPGVGAGIIDWYGGQSFIGYPFCAMLSQNWLINKACTIPAEDAVRKGFDITLCGTEVVPDEYLNRLKKLDKKFKLSDNLIEAERMCRIFGIRIVMFNIENPGWTDDERREFYRRPFNIDGVELGSYKGISQVDPNYITPMFDQSARVDPGAMDYLEPTWWRISGMYSLEVHRSHLVVIRTCTMPDYLKALYWYGGIPVPQQVYRRVYAGERTADEAPMLTLSKRLLVLTTQMSGAIANPAAFWSRLKLLAKTRDNSSVYAVNNETGETVQQFDTNLSDFDSVMMSQYQLVAAIAGIPPEKFVMTALKGFSPTGEYQESIYHEMLETVQASHLTQIVDRHHELTIKSEFSERFEVEIVWKSLDSMTAKEEAEVKLIGAQAAKTLWETGGLSAEQINSAIVKDPKSGFEVIDDERFNGEDEPLTSDT